MEVSALSSSDSILDIYGEKVRSEVEMAEKIAKINMELKMKSDQFALAEKALMDFYA